MNTNQERLLESSRRIRQSDPGMVAWLRELKPTPELSRTVKAVQEQLVDPDAPAGLSPGLEEEILLQRLARPVLPVSLLQMDGGIGEGWLSRFPAAATRQVVDFSAPSVGRIDLPGHPRYRWIGTGWPVEKDLIITSARAAVILSELANGGLGGISVGIRFERSLGMEDFIPFTEIVYLPQPGGPFVALLRIPERSLDQSRVLPLALSTSPPAESGPVAMIAYPALDSRNSDKAAISAFYGDTDRGKSILPGRIIGSGDGLLRHDCTIAGDLSGAPLFDLNTATVAGIHLSGSFLQQGTALGADAISSIIASSRQSGTITLAAPAVAAGATTTVRQPQVDEPPDFRPIFELPPASPIPLPPSLVPVPPETASLAPATTNPSPPSAPAVGGASGSPATVATSIAEIDGGIVPSADPIDPESVAGFDAECLRRKDIDPPPSENKTQSQALSLATACLLAGNENLDLIKRVATSKWGCTDCRAFSQADVRGMVAWNDDFLLVAFAGAEDTARWLADLNMTRVKRPYGKIQINLFDRFVVIERSLRQFLAEVPPSPNEVRRVWLTGHGAGGALAMILAAECADCLPPVTGLFTYGQPRTGDKTTRGFIDGRLAGRYHRYVNGDDIVAQVPPPPSLRHAGKLIRLGQDERSVNGCNLTEAKEPMNGPPHDDWLASIDLENEDHGTAWISSTPDTPPVPEVVEMVAARSAEDDWLSEMVLEEDEDCEEAPEEAIDDSDEKEAGSEAAASTRNLINIIPRKIYDHKLARYIRRLRRLVPAKPVIDDAVQLAVVQELSKGAAPNQQPGQGIPEIPVLIRLKPALEDSGSGPPAPGSVPVPAESRLEDLAGLNIQSQIGPVVTALATAEAIQALKQRSGDIDIIESSREISETAAVELDRSVPCVYGVPPGQPRPNVGDQGDSAIVAFIDTGIDILHHAFLDGTQKTRILAIWDQKATASGRDPQSVTRDKSQPNYGTLYLRKEIQNYINGPDALVPTALRDLNGHGTHVASIAAGRAAGSFAGGLAEDARIILVIPDLQQKGYQVSHVDGLNFIKFLAAKLQMPVVVNVSSGLNAGAHDGSSTLEAAFNAFCQDGMAPGLAIVKSAGNERSFNGHATAFAAQNAISEITWNSKLTQRHRDYLEVWFGPHDEIHFTLLDPSNQLVCGPVSAKTPLATQMAGGNLCRMALSLAPNGLQCLTIIIDADGNGNIASGNWILEIEGKTINGSGDLYAWIEKHERIDGAAVEFSSSCASYDRTISIPGTAKSVIAVGACGTGAPWRLNRSSSWGFTADNSGLFRPGMSKPEICAPGESILAAYSQGFSRDAVIARSGTSMAAPHVSGAIALVFSHLKKHHPAQQATASQIQVNLGTSAGNTRHNKGYGYGRLNVVNFFRSFPTSPPAPPAPPAS